MKSLLIEQLTKIQNELDQLKAKNELNEREKVNIVKLANAKVHLNNCINFIKGLYPETSSEPKHPFNH